MTYNDAPRRTSHPNRGGESNASPGVYGERGRVEDQNTYRGVPHLERGGGPNISPQLGGKGCACPYHRGKRKVPQGQGAPPYSTRKRGASPDSGRERGASPPSGREKEGRREKGSQQDQFRQSTRRSHTSRELRMLDPSEKPPSKKDQTVY